MEARTEHGAHCIVDSQKPRRVAPHTVRPSRPTEASVYTLLFMRTRACTSRPDNWLRLLTLAVIGAFLPLASCSSSSPEAGPLSIRVSDSVSESQNESRQIFEFVCASGEPDLILIVGLVRPPNIAMPVDSNQRTDGLYGAAVHFACRAPSDGTVRLILDMPRVRQSFGDDVTVLAALVRRISLMEYADSRVKGGVSRTPREITRNDLTDDLRPFGHSDTFSPLSEGLGMFQRHGYGRLIGLDDSNLNTLQSARIAP